MKFRDGIFIHQGDNRTELGEGDDEVIPINLWILNQSISSMNVIVNSFKGQSIVGLRSDLIL